MQISKDLIVVESGLFIYYSYITYKITGINKELAVSVEEAAKAGRF